MSFLFTIQLKIFIFPLIVLKRGYKENNKNNNHPWAQRFAIQWEKPKFKSICLGNYVRKKKSSIFIIDDF